MARDTEKKAIEIVLKYEKLHGRSPKDVSGKKLGYDVESGGRLIEVKGMSAQKGDYIPLYKKLFVKLGQRFKDYYIYVIFDIKNRPKLRILNPETILSGIEIETYFMIKLKNYSNLPEEDLSGIIGPE